jgi:hypothetical protein
MNSFLISEIDINVLKGFEGRGAVPINFPQDICMFRINNQSFAAGLSYGKNGAENVLSIFHRVNKKFQLIKKYLSKYLTKIDCRAVNNVGYVAIVNTIQTNMKPDELLKKGSFVLRIWMNDKDEVLINNMQTFAELNQLKVRLWNREQNLYLVYSYHTNSSSPLTMCTVFKLITTSFDPIDNLPCQNARVIEFFTVNHDLMVLIGNHRENNGTFNAVSTIMRYDLTHQKFVEHQKLLTNGITVGKYFFLDQLLQRQHFIFVGNLYEIDEFGSTNYNVLSIVYKFVDGFFIPLQTINVKHVQDVTPVLVSN